ncbi:hypothetical protein HMPREF0591_1686 [Mycobacterium parascrofulaceum ATCC BAA-614]|uniref:Uncharacterized protein n=1 Tax=Mycobacterium parascrofulaceum ATCC BAA-614 TaxID=525368 RepID=D5P692_9MYCO|nr:hypothetical protein HMPREF0591_1686 [Mycobacterium parascrofulaceum ATCC BAA-614]
MDPPSLLIASSLPHQGVELGKIARSNANAAHCAADVDDVHFG